MSSYILISEYRKGRSEHGTDKGTRQERKIDKAVWGLCKTTGALFIS